ncbi:C-8 sterol isomerase [Savitreella phatthalungensis]
MISSLAKTLAVLLLLWSVADQYVDRLFVFDHAKLQELSRASISLHGNDTSALLTHLTRSLREEYGNAVVEWSKEDWFFNNAGGAMGTMVILHASVTEYLIFFGTALETEGHSGVHMADDYFTILHGEQHAAYPGDLRPTVYRPGDQNHLRRGDAIQYAMPTTCFALELAQGWIPAMLPFGFADTFSSTLDWYNLYKTVKLTAINMVVQTMRGKI